MTFRILILALALALALGTFASAQDITSVGHDDLEPIISPAGRNTDLYIRFQPAIRVPLGCVPFPAVGEYTISGGLNPSGAVNGDCGSSPGQVYARSKQWDNGRRAIMYAYYFPKDQRVLGGGHRHDWEEVVVFVSQDWDTAYGVALSAHGEYNTADSDWIDETHYAVSYVQGGGGILNHEFQSDEAKDGYYKHPLANWAWLSEGVKYAINNGDFGAASPKIADDKFDEKMDEAYNKFY